MPLLEIADTFIERAQKLCSKSELFRLLEDVTSELGFYYFALIHHTDLQGTSPDIIHFQNYPLSWSEYFIENRLYSDDPILRASLTSHIGFMWTDVPRMIPITSRQRFILERASKFGMGEGFTVLANIPGECSGSCSFAMRKGHRLPEDNLLAAQLIGGFAYQAARRISRNGFDVPLTPKSLTPRQHDCLVLAIQGKTD